MRKAFKRFAFALLAAIGLTCLALGLPACDNKDCGGPGAFKDLFDDGCCSGISFRNSAGIEVCR